MMNEKRLNEELGARIRSILESKEEIKKLADKVIKIYPNTHNGEWAREMALKWAYAGCILSALNKQEVIPNLEKYARLLKKRYERKPFEDPDYTIREIYDIAFK